MISKSAEGRFYPLLPRGLREVGFHGPEKRIPISYDAWFGSFGFILHVEIGALDGIGDPAVYFERVSLDLLSQKCTG